MNHLLLFLRVIIGEVERLGLVIVPLDERNFSLTVHRMLSTRISLLVFLSRFEEEALLVERLRILVTVISLLNHMC